MKRGFSRMILGGGIILLVVLFFVSVYGVKEGFGTNECVEGKTYSEPTVSSDGRYLDRCYTNNCKQSQKSKGTCYYGTLNSKNKLTSYGHYEINADKVVKE